MINFNTVLLSADIGSQDQIQACYYSNVKKKIVALPYEEFYAQINRQVKK